MFDLTIATGLRANTFLLIGIGILFCYIAGWIWRRYGSHEFPTRGQAAGFTLMVIVLVAGLFIGRRPDWDEIEHVHTAWLINQGLLPYTDFFQNHPPGLWLMLSPIMGFLPHNGVVCDIIRSIALALSGGTLWFAAGMSRRIWARPGTGALITLLILGQSASLELYNLRPDLLANLLAIGGVWCLVGGCPSRRLLCTGVLMGLAFSVTPRLWFLFPWILFWLFWESRRIGSYWRQAFEFSAGSLIGLMPLALYLVLNNLTSDFFHWSYLFNISGHFVAKGRFPFVITGLAVWGGVEVLRSKTPEIRPGGRLLVFGFVLSAVCYAIQPNHDLQYGQQFWGFIAAALAAGPALKIIRHLIISGRMAFVLLAVLFILWQPLQSIQHWVREGGYFRGRNEIARLMEIAGGEPVVCVPPGHPILAPNATYLSHPWQLFYWLDRPDVAASLEGITGKIIHSRPAIILDRSPDDRPALIDILKHQEIITPGEHEVLKEFLLRHYELVEIGYHSYWVRRDRI